MYALKPKITDPKKTGTLLSFPKQIAGIKDRTCLANENFIKIILFQK
jgi:hypothetical protein